MTTTLYSNCYDMYGNIVATRVFNVDTEWLVKYHGSNLRYDNKKAMRIYYDSILDNAFMGEWFII